MCGKRSRKKDSTTLRSSVASGRTETVSGSVQPDGVWSGMRLPFLVAVYHEGSKESNEGQGVERKAGLGNVSRPDGTFVRSDLPCVWLAGGIHSMANMSELDELQAKITHHENVAWHFRRDRPELDGLV